ncbi:MAG: hypothetical protein MJB12_13340 [Firmicutes bacterium]|nr:hypothetical protein [Bacillota bacterium]
MRLSRVAKYKLQKKEKRRFIVFFYIMIPLFTILLGYMVTRVFITPIAAGG